ncbi:SPOR domain-containing protein [Thiohalorhabdus sp.]|uniref:SPOR domain-containing protein n=1 Tax=Thiohalorhabdus sp. TaxID=3094134 RepID=UPI002FC2E459
MKAAGALDGGIAGLTALAGLLTLLGFAVPALALAAPDAPRIQVRIGEPGSRSAARALADDIQGVETAVNRVVGGHSVVAGVFESPEKARRRRQRLRKLGYHSVRLVVLPERAAEAGEAFGGLLQVRAGAPGSRDRARRLARELERAGIAYEVIRVAGGYSVSAGAFASSRNAADLVRRLRSQEVAGVRLVWLPDSAEEGTPISSDKRRAALAQASREAGRAESRETVALESGERFRVHRRTRRRRVYQVQITSYQDWGRAQADAARLRRLGYLADPNPLRGQRGYGMALDAFLDRDEARQYRNRVRKLGFPRAGIRTLTTTVTRYRVEPLTGAEAPGAATPAAGQETAEKTGKTEKAGEQEASEVLVFGEAGVAAPGQKPATAGEGGAKQDTGSEGRDNFRVRLDTMRAEGGRLIDPAGDRRGSHYLHAAGYAEWQPEGAWSARLGARADGYWETGDPGVSEGRLDYGPSYVRYESRDLRLTMGAQKILWGRVDAMPPTDRMSTPDLRRYVLDDLTDRRLPVPALRLEGFQGPWKTDLVWVPAARHALLPDRDSVWSPVDSRRGRVINLDDDPFLARLVRQGTVEDGDEYGGGEFGLRIGYTGRSAEGSFVVQRVRRSDPYYELDPTARRTLLAGGTPAQAVQSASGPTFRERHPLTWLLGGDLVIPDYWGTWRLEVAGLSNVPRTTPDLEMVTPRGWEAVVGNEFFPGDGDFRVNLQLAGRGVTGSGPYLDRRDAYHLAGSLEWPFFHGRWNAKLDFSVGIDERDNFANPEIAFQGWDPHTFYLGAYLFSGAAQTPGGFHEDHDMAVLGWRSFY